MADAELLKVGPFEGIDLTSADIFVKPGIAASASNVNTTRIDGALMAEKGRTLLLSLSGTLTTITAIFPCVVYLTTGPNSGASDQPAYLIQGMNGGTLTTVLYCPTASPTTVTLSATAGIASFVAFDQAEQFGNVVYLNSGFRLFIDSAVNGTNQQFFQWQYPNPDVYHSGVGADITLNGTGTGTVPAGTYYYTLTQTTTMPDGSISETSAHTELFANPASVTLAAPHSIVVTRGTGPPAFPFTGTNADGSTFTTNLYRMSAAQPTWLFLANLTTNSPYTDNATDASIASNAQLQTFRDAPPIFTPAGPLGGAVSLPAAISIHKNRLWVFASVAAFTPTPGVLLPQVQLWYSNLARGWEFNSTSQVLLLNSDVTSLSGNLGQVSYSALYGNEPVSVAPVGSVLAAQTRRDFWAIYGDDPTSFLQRRLFNIGCTSRHSVTPAVGGIFWLSENGAYFFDGSAPQYDSESIRGALRAIGSTGASPADQQKATGAFANMTWYLAFPTLNTTYSYYTVTGRWLATLPYAPASTGGLAYVPAHPSSIGGTDLNEVVAVRAGSPPVVDWWFADANDDLGNPLTCTWNSPYTDSGQLTWGKVYRYVVLLAPIQHGTAVVTVTTDPGAPTSTSRSVTFDLSGTTAGDHGPRHIASLGDGAGGALRGFTMRVSVVLTGVAGFNAPVVWALSVVGDFDRNLAIPV